MIPNNVLIGGHLIEIELVDPDNRLLLKEDEFLQNFGLCVYSENKIYINKDLSESLKEECLIHEIKHMIDFYSSRKNYLSQFKDLNEEYQNLLTDNIFWRFLKDNTNFFKDRILIANNRE